MRYLVSIAIASILTLTGCGKKVAKKPVEAPQVARNNTESTTSPPTQSASPATVSTAPAKTLPTMPLTGNTPPTVSTVRTSPPVDEPKEPIEPVVKTQPTPPTQPSRPNTNNNNIVRRLPGLVDMKELGTAIAIRRTSNEGMPNKEEVLEATAGLGNLAGLIKYGSIILTGTRDPGGLWAYEIDADKKGGFVLVNGTASRATADEVRKLLGSK